MMKMESYMVDFLLDDLGVGEEPGEEEVRAAVRDYCIQCIEATEGETETGYSEDELLGIAIAFEEGYTAGLEKRPRLLRWIEGIVAKCLLIKSPKKP